MSETNKSDPLEIYFDRVRVSTGIFGVNISLSLGPAHPKNEEEALTEKELIVARTSLAHAKLFAMILEKQLKTYEDKTQIKIQMPSEVYKELGLDESKW